MCNCGNKRTSLNQPKAATELASAPTSIVAPVAINRGTAPQPTIVFEYTGKTALTVIGTITGKRYRFNNPGDLQPIDVRDASGMKAVPVLRKR